MDNLSSLSFEEQALLLRLDGKSSCRGSALSFFDVDEAETAIFNALHDEVVD